jgi:hypothetical protein
VPFLNSFPYLNAPHDYAGATYGSAKSATSDKPSTREQAKQADAGGVLPLLQSMMQGIANILPG